MKRSGLTWACPVMVFVLAAACGGSTPPPEQPKPEPTVKAPPPPDPEPVAEEPKVDTPEEPPPEEPKGPRRPLAIYNDSTGPQTVGLDGAVFRLGGAELRIPGGSLSVARNVFFHVDKKARGDQGKIGDVYMIEVQVPDSKYQMGDARPSRAQPSSGDPFVLKIPLPQGKDSANLAVESVEMDAKNKGKSTWTVIAQTKLETADSGNRAVFELNMLPDAHVHLTTKAAAE